MLVCDGRIAFVGGFNVAPEYEGDGETRGWCDLGLSVTGELVAELAAAFDTMFARADFRHKILSRFLKREATLPVGTPKAQLLLGGPGRGVNPIARALHADLGRAREVRIMVAYFLPTRQLRADLLRTARRGCRVQLLLAGRSDVPLSHLAGRSLYRRFLKAGVEIYEYQPQVLHAKLFLIDLALYAGSANLDTRSLRINYELMLRLKNAELAASAHSIFDRRLSLSRRITAEDWARSNSLWRRLKHRLAYFVLVQLDPFIAGRQWRRLSD
jgi:cardiolipin synthase